MSRRSVRSWLAVLLALLASVGGEPFGASTAAGAGVAPQRTLLVPAVPNRTDLGAGVMGEQPRRLAFGVYPGGRTGESPTAPLPDPRAVMQGLADLAGGRPFLVHLSTAWSWYDPAYLDA